MKFVIGYSINAAPLCRKNSFGVKDCFRAVAGGVVGVGDSAEV